MQHSVAIFTTMKTRIPSFELPMQKGKNVCTLSTMHSSPTTDTSTEKKKPEIV